MDEISFTDDRALLKRALLRALRVQARLDGSTPAVFSQVAEAFDRQNDPNPPPIPRPAELREFFGDEPPLALVFFDTPGLQDYVFKVQRPVDIFGGSRQIADFTEPGPESALSLFQRLKNAPTALPAEDVTIYAGAGSGLLLVAAREAAATIAAIEEILLGATAGDLQTRAAALPVWPDELAAGPADVTLDDLFLFTIPESGESGTRRKAPSRYAATLAALLGRHQRERSRRQAWPPAMDAEQQFDRCEACGGRHATGRRSRGENEFEPLCQPCLERWRYAGRKRQMEPRSFEELLAGLDTDLAVIYADGANAGDLFTRLDTPARHRALSRTVESALAKAALAADERLHRIYPRSDDDDELRYQKPIQGGDDLILVVPARGALEVAVELIGAFERTVDEAAASPAFKQAPACLRKALERFGLGLGVAVGPMHFPIQFLLHYARELLKNAKQLTRSRSEGPTARSALDFLVLRGGTPLSGGIAELRKRHQEKKVQGEMLAFHRRPLSSEDLRSFVAASRALCVVPRAQIQAIRRELQRGRVLSRNLWRYQHSRSAEWASWRAEAAVGVPLERVDEKLWRHEGGRWVTDFLDQVEALDLVSKNHLNEANTGRADGNEG